MIIKNLKVQLVKNKKFKKKTYVLKKLKSKNYRIKIAYSGICASDIPRCFNNGAYSYPLVIGHEFSGQIIDKSKNLKKYKIGDKVSVFPLIPKCKKCKSCQIGDYQLCENYSYFGSRQDGSFSNYLDVPEWNIFKLPNSIDLKIACLIEPIAVAYNIFDKMKIKNSSANILILGSGFIGQILARILYFNNFKNITCLDRNIFKLRYIKKFSNQTLNSLSSIKKKNKFNFIIDLIGNDEIFNSALNILESKGKMICAANIYSDQKFSRNSFNKLLRKELSIQGIWNSTYKIKKNNWNSALNFIKRYSKYVNELITQEILLKNSNIALNEIYLSKNKKNKLKSIKCVIKNN